MSQRVTQHKEVKPPDHQLLRSQGGAVKVSDVTYRGFSGTSLTEEAIRLDCCKLGCSGIVMEKVKLTPASTLGRKVTSYCKNAHGKASSTTPNVPCLSES
ncbi:Glycoside hydrolase [Parasponia andersonii]|uniref:Glycoside hydrolase n=1 Tax=Parasponia andersonii TaxID=3476 RepID=A0A2P5ANG0_PARAD|nr:Glycoside hydrolase [Parasponia andersonii]